MPQAFHLLPGFAENQIVFWDFKIENRVRITKVLDNIQIIEVLLYYKIFINADLHVQQYSKIRTITTTTTNTVPLPLPL